MAETTSKAFVKASISLTMVIGHPIDIKIALQEADKFETRNVPIGRKKNFAEFRA